MVAAVGMRDEDGLVLAAKKNSGLRGDTAERLAFRIQQIPFAGDVFRLWHKG
ncbi:hypothetical protein SDC9_182369 [bioreactor metagenome]|uniref:Uncharacterized protein n=1 Tax=bioreactor metagenome TaxID=1076179 RepID=A0A645H7A3_9ZZZZ